MEECKTFEEQAPKAKRLKGEITCDEVATSPSKNGNTWSKDDNVPGSDKKVRCMIRGLFQVLVHVPSVQEKFLWSQNQLDICNEVGSCTQKIEHVLHRDLFCYSEKSGSSL